MNSEIIPSIFWFVIFLMTFPAGITIFNLPDIVNIIICVLGGFYAGHLLARILLTYEK